MRTLLIIWLLMMTAVVATEAVYKINFNLDKKDVVELTDLKLLFFTSSSIIAEGEYTILELTENGEVLYNMSFSVFFMVLSDPPIEVDKQSVLFFLPYNKNTKYITINHKEKEIFRQDLSITCNSDGNCGKFESFLSCPEDCTQENDDICIPAENGVCDPQCAEGVDPDCPKEIQFSWWYVIPILLVIVIFFALRKND